MKFLPVPSLCYLFLHLSACWFPIVFNNLLFEEKRTVPSGVIKPSISAGKTQFPLKPEDQDCLNGPRQNLHRRGSADSGSEGEVCVMGKKKKKAMNVDVGTGRVDGADPVPFYGRPAWHERS